MTEFQKAIKAWQETLPEYQQMHERAQAIRNAKVDMIGSYRSIRLVTPNGHICCGFSTSYNMRRAWKFVYQNYRKMVDYEKGI